MNYSAPFILSVLALIFAALSFVWPVMLNVAVILLSIAALLWTKQI